MNLFMKIFAAILKLIAFYSVVTGVFLLWPRKKYPQAAPRNRFAVLIAARDEENVIGNLIESLRRQEYPAELYDIFVVPNNCTDNTESVARRAGAKILACPEPVRRKGDVLRQAFAQLRGQYDAYCVFDADNIVDAAFLARMNDAAVSGAQVAKSRQKALNPYDNWVSGCYDIYFENFHLLFNLPRMVLPLSCKLIGTGFMVTDSLLQRLGGWNTDLLSEDFEFAAQCAELGVRVHYVPDALTLDEQPLSFKVSLRQRRRWSAGVQSVANRYVPRLLGMRPSWLRWDMAQHVTMVYVQLLAMIPVAYGLIGLTPLDIVKTLGISFLGFWLGMTLLGLFLSITARRNPLKMWSAILLYPLFTASWYPLHIISLFAKPKAWKYIAHGTDKERQGKTPVA